MLLFRRQSRPLLLILAARRAHQLIMIVLLRQNAIRYAQLLQTLFLL